MRTRDFSRELTLRFCLFSTFFLLIYVLKLLDQLEQIQQNIFSRKQLRAYENNIKLCCRIKTYK